MDERSMLDIAYEIISNAKAGVGFNELFDNVTAIKGKTEEEKASLIGRFYSDLLLDGRFLVLDDNVWDLRERYTFEKSHTEMDVYQSFTESDESAEDKEENKELVDMILIDL